jgi:hypothetical protein
MHARVLLLLLVKLGWVLPRLLLLLEVLLWSSEQCLLAELLLVNWLLFKGQLLLLLLHGRVPQRLVQQQLLLPVCRQLPMHTWLLLVLLLHVRCLWHLHWAIAAAELSCINLRLLPKWTPEVTCTVLRLLLHCRPHLSHLPHVLLRLTLLLLLLLLWVHNLPSPVLLPALRRFCLPLRCNCFLLRCALRLQSPLPEVCTPVMQAAHNDMFV